ncbi:serine/threonine-protein kinase [Micromonospora lupini]|uniref:non-specific serine/threonine protein kinase n=1 Tax=Micromonospora lupini str. Lupac 08 TaxID=1150864 RepID=I0L6H3_9ACTN|nr:serine/threonine-protein kinase [Micromonospora lupini]CCH19420.1 Putative serine/threonine protein kinase [Micromonospora lupini str. Lupac 08]
MQAGDRVGDRYELTYPVGRGGMGQVWAGFDERLDRPVAIKFLRQLEVPEDERETAGKRFRREARATARLDHPGVPAVHDLGVHGEDLFLVMQLVPGIVLADHIAEQERLPVGEAASIAAQVCSVLAAAHAASLVHRDLKPQNLMITPSRVVKVLDFGVAALLGPAEASRLTATGRTLGTPAYIAPEQAQGGPVGPAADLYALGCILFEMLGGNPPYEAANAPDMMRRHIDAPIPIITEYRSDVPDDLAHLVYCLLAKDPAERPASAGEVRQLLKPFLDDGDSPGLVAARADNTFSSTAPHAAPAPVPPQRSPQNLVELRAQARELAENERFVQAAEMVERALRMVPQGGERLGTEIVALRVDLANLLMLAGDFRQAHHAFAALARDLDQSDEEQDLVEECRHQAMVCQLEMGESADATGPL